MASDVPGEDAAYEACYMTNPNDLDFMDRLAIRDAALDALAATVPTPDLSDHEVTIPGSVGRWTTHGPHTHGTWEPGHTASGHVVWSCGGCHFTPRVRVPLPDLGRSILDEWWDGYRVDLAARCVVEPAA